LSLHSKVFDITKKIVLQSKTGVAMEDAVQQTVRVIDSSRNCPDIPIVIGPGNAKAVIWPGSGAQHRSMHLVSLSQGSKTIPLSHASDSVYYVMSGAGTVSDVTSGDVMELSEGSMVHIDAGDTYRFEATGTGMKLVGGPCPADPSLYAALPEVK
jgi:quercetin dioxygenase-like cupin family protein